MVTFFFLFFELLGWSLALYGFGFDGGVGFGLLGITIAFIGMALIKSIGNKELTESDQDQFLSLDTVHLRDEIRDLKKVKKQA